MDGSNASKTVCFKSTINISFRTYEAISSSTTLTLQLIDPASENIVVRLFNVNTSASQYQFKLTQTGTSLVVETSLISAGRYLNTNLRLFDSYGITLITSNFGGKSNGFSKITYTLPNLPNPCPSVQNLVSPTNDIAAGQTKTIKGVAITATNKVANATAVDYRGEKTITLNLDFETQINSGGT